MQAFQLPTKEHSTDIFYTDELVSFLTKANKAYRAGKPIIDDYTYAHVYLAKLKKREPEHPYLKSVEPEGQLGKSKVIHDEPMLSMDKAYTLDDIKRFIGRVEKTAIELGIDHNALEFKVTQKLDGMAGKYTNGRLVTRGNGLVGNDVTHVFGLGVLPYMGANTGTGEIVLDQSYFDEHLSDKFSHPRNVVVGIVGAEQLSQEAEATLKAGAVRFIPYSSLYTLYLTVEELIYHLDEASDTLIGNTQYPTDGIVIEVADERIKNAMGSTSHHHRWQIAKKEVNETAQTTVTAITWQTGRTGRVTPVINIDPVHISGAQVTKVTGHNGKYIQKNKLGTGAKVVVVRSGEVIPKILTVTEPSDDVLLPSICPSCMCELEWENEFIVCTTTNCSSVVVSQLVHFFKTLGNIDLFGKKTTQKLVDHNYDDLPVIYSLTNRDFQSIGFGPKQSSNLVKELKRSRTEAIEDWRFLAAFGIRHLELVESRKLLSIYTLDDLPRLNTSDILKISGFARHKASEVADELYYDKMPLIDRMLHLGFNLIRTTDNKPSQSPITGKHIVFTGILSVPRKTAQQQATELGAHVQASVNKKTDYLVIGENVGSKKINSAKQLSINVITEAEYHSLINNKSVA